MVRRQIERNGKAMLLIIVIAALGIVSTFSVLSRERLQSPFQKTYDIDASFVAATAVAPGLGEAVNVAGVKVGQIAGVSLKDGYGVLHMKLDPAKLSKIHTDARAALVPNTPLKDMQVNLDPGSADKRVLKSGSTIPLSRTTIPVDAEELLAALDGDSRAWLRSLLADSERGLRGRSGDLRALLRALGPTSRQVRRIGDLLASRRRQLPHLVHNLALLAGATGRKDRELATLVTAGDQTLGALAQEDVALRATVAKLPGTLAQVRSTLAHATPLARELGPTADALLPTVRRLPSTLKGTRSLFQSAALAPLHELPKFVSVSQPLARALTPAVRDLTAATPPLTEAFKVLAATTNALAYNSGGADQGFLYWTSWFFHNAASAMGTGDANGAVWRGLGLISCSSLLTPDALGQTVGTLLGALPLCPPAGSATPAKANGGHG